MQSVPWQCVALAFNNKIPLNTSYEPQSDSGPLYKVFNVQVTNSLLLMLTRKWFRGAAVSQRLIVSTANSTTVSEAAVQLRLETAETADSHLVVHATSWKSVMRASGTIASKAVQTSVNHVGSAIWPSAKVAPL